VEDSGVLAASIGVVADVRDLGLNRHLYIGLSVDRIA
jgi:hypothetical protein